MRDLELQIESPGAIAAGSGLAANPVSRAPAALIAG
jgi:hypothetical protein